MIVKYSLNGNKFKDFGINVSESKGLADILQPKKNTSYEWPEYNGYTFGNNKPLFEAREIELECFIAGDNWQSLFDNFNNLLRKEFSKRGTQRLLVEPFEFKILPYEVILANGIELKKEFRQGQMIGTFTLKLIEPNPIKKVYFTAANTVNISFYTDKIATIFWGDGTWSNVRGNVSISRNYNTTLFQYGQNQTVSIYGDYYQMNGLQNALYSFSLDARFTTSGEKAMYLVGKTDAGTYEFIESVKVVVAANTFTKFEIIKKVDVSHYAKFFLKLSENAEVKKIQIKKATPQNYTPVAGRKNIIIAGNIDEIENITTTAELLWEKL